MSIELTFDDDKFHEECGLMAVWNHPEAANLTYLGLYAQQHRGQEGAGVVALDGNTHSLAAHKGLGLIADVFKRFDFAKLPGSCAIGHLRYSTAGGNILANVQPFLAELASGPVAIAHNGNLVNTAELRKELMSSGAIFSCTSDTELVLHLLAHSNGKRDPLEAVNYALSKLSGAYSFLLIFKDRLFAIRDPHGLRPLAMGRLGDGFVFASETCAFDLIGADFFRHIEPGEVLEIDLKGKITSHFPQPKREPTPCVFEYIYFARPDSNVFGRGVYAMRRAFGAQLAKEAPATADIVVGVPDSGVTAAIGYSAESKLPLELGLIRNHYIGRTFIEPSQSIRDFGVKIKLNANQDALKGKRIVVIDDSIVRGTTSRKLVRMLRAAGASEIHMRISSPPTVSPCYYGIDTPSKQELIASSNNVEEIRNFIEADSLAYLSIEGLYKALGSERGSFCDACFSGRYMAGVPSDV